MENAMQKNNLKFAYWGTPEVASKTLETLISSGYIPAVVVTSPDKPSGRGLVIQSTPVKILAEKHNIEVLTPEKIDAEFIDKISSLNLELNIVVAYGKILPIEIINMPKYNTLNIHYSLLPKYRGASPLECALLNGDNETGVSIQKMVFKMDAGPVVAEKKISIDNSIDKNTLREILINEGGKLLTEIIPSYIENKIIPKEQDENLATRCGKIKKEDGEINLQDQDIVNWNKYRAYSGWPGIFFFKDGKRIKISKAKFENDKFTIEKVIPESSKEINYINI